MSKERELKIYEILLKHLTWNDTKGAKKGARALINLGYTKQQFDIGKLKAWLEEKVKNKVITTSDYEEGFYNGKRESLEEVLDKIAELETQQKEGR